MSIFTAAQRRSLERISGHYLKLGVEESDFTVSDVFSLGILLTNELSKTTRDQNLIDYYKSSYLTLCSALKISNPEIFLLRLSNKNPDDAWNDFSDFKSVWYPKWFANQIFLRHNLFDFTDEEDQKIKPDFWGATCSDDNVKTTLIHVRDSFKQIRVGVLALVFKIDESLVSLLGWKISIKSVSWQELKNKFHFPTYTESVSNS